MHPRLVVVRRAGSFAMTAAIVALALSPAVRAATYTWIGTGNSQANPWTDPNQWDPVGPHNFVDTGAELGDDLIFGNSLVTTVFMRANSADPGGAEERVNSLMFQAGAPAYTFTTDTADHDIDLFGPMVNNSGVIQTFATGIAFDTANCIVTGATGDTNTNYAFECGHHIWLGGSPTYNGPFDVHVSGTGTQALQALNVTINDAKIVVEGGMTASGTYTVGGNGTVILNGAWNPSSSGTTVTKQGTGMLILNGASNNTARPWTIANGIVRVGDSLAMGNATRAVTVNGNTAGLGTLQLYNNITLNKNLTVQARQNASATIVAVQNYSGNNTIGGNITVSTGGGLYNFGSINAGEKLSVTGNLVTGGSATGTRIFTFRGAGDGEFSGAGFGQNYSTNNSNMPVFQYGTGVVTLNSANTYRLGHVIVHNGGTVKFGANFGNNDGDPTNYPLFAPSDDFSVPNPSRIVLLGGSKLDVSAATSLHVPTTTYAGLNRVLAGTGTVIGDVMTVPADTATTTNPYRNAYPGGKAVLMPGDGINTDPTDPNGLYLQDNNPSLSLTTFPSAVGTLTFQNSLALASGDTELVFDLQNGPGGTNDRIVVGGDLTLSGVTTVSVNGTLSNGTYRLIDYTGTLTGDASNFAVVLTTPAGRKTITIDVSTPHQINLVVGGSQPADLTWVGGQNSNAWDVIGTVNWTGAPGPSFDNRFFQGDSVSFTDAGSNTPNVNIAVPVAPNAMTLTNSAGHTYTFVGSDLNVTTMLAMNGSGTAVFANTGTLSADSIQINSGTLVLDRTETLALAADIGGSGTLQKLGTGVVSLDGNNATFGGPMVVTAGTLKANGDSALGGGGTLAAGVTVADGATLDIVNGTTTTGTGTEAVAIAGFGVDNKGALTVATATNSNGHVNKLILDADARISAIGAGAGSAGRSILWVDGVSAEFQGNGHNLSAVVDVGGDISNATEIDILDVGDMNVNNLELAGGGAFYIGGNTTLGPTSGTVTLLEFGRLGLYGHLAGTSALTNVIDKPIAVAPSLAGGGIEVYAGSASLSGPITMNANLDLTCYPRANNTTSTLTLTGPLTGSGSLTVHCNANGTTSRRGMVELVSDNNTYAGTTTIGGNGGMSQVTANDRAYLSIGNGGATGSLPPGDVINNWVLRFNRTGVLNVPNNISGDGGDVFLDSPDAVVSLTGMNTYSGVTRINAGTLKVNGMHTGGNAYYVENGGTLDLTAAAVTPVSLNGLNVADGAAFTFRLDTPFSTADDQLVVVGEADLSAVTTLVINAVSLGGPALPAGSYLLIAADTLTTETPGVAPAVDFHGAVAQSASLSIAGNNLYLVIGAQALPPDIEPIGGDGDVDFQDLLALMNCFSGPDVPYAQDCAMADFDTDGDSDQSDFGIWQSCFAGAGMQAEQPRCTRVQVQ